MKTYSKDIDTTDLIPGSLCDHFLIAMPGMEDGFAHSVTYICEHNENGAMGIIINNPMALTLHEIFAQMHIDVIPGQGHQTVLSGGPVQQERGFVLHGSDTEWHSTLKISSDLHLTASRDIITALAEGKGRKNISSPLVMQVGARVN